MLSALPFVAMAQHEEDTENGVVSLAGREGFTIETKRRLCIQTLFACTDQWQFQLV